MIQSASPIEITATLVDVHQEDLAQIWVLFHAKAEIVSAMGRHLDPVRITAIVAHVVDTKHFLQNIAMIFASSTRSHRIREVILSIATGGITKNRMNETLVTTIVAFMVSCCNPTLALL